MSEKQEPKKDKFDEFGQIAGGYDLGMARGFALEHAKKTFGEYVGEGEDRRPLLWKIERAGWDEDAECWEVVLTAEPERAQVEQKGIWVYHVRPVGGLLPGTPLLRQSLMYTVPGLTAGALAPAATHPTAPAVSAPAPPSPTGARAAPPTPAPAAPPRPAAPPIPAAPLPPAPAAAVAAGVTPGMLLAIAGTGLLMLSLFLSAAGIAFRWLPYLALLAGVAGAAIDGLAGRYRPAFSLCLGFLLGILITLWLFIIPMGYEFGHYYPVIAELNPLAWLLDPYSLREAIALRMPVYYAAMAAAMGLSSFIITKRVKHALMVGATGFLAAWSLSVLAVQLVALFGWRVGSLLAPLLVLSYAAPAFVAMRSGKRSPSRR